jgi:hypothetical protein
MWNFYASSVKKGEGLLHACISSLDYKLSVIKIFILLLLDRRLEILFLRNDYMYILNT